MRDYGSQRIFASAVNALTFLEAKSRPSRPLENEYFGAPAHRGIQRRKGRTGDFELLFTLHPSKKFKADTVLRARAACVTVGDGSAAAAQSASICARTKSSSCIASRTEVGVLFESRHSCALAGPSAVPSLNTSASSMILKCGVNVHVHVHAICELAVSPHEGTGFPVSGTIKRRYDVPETQSHALSVEPAHNYT